MDIKAAFLSVGKGRLIHTMRFKGMDRDHIQWTASFLTDQTDDMVIAGNVMERRPVDAGLPQGSPLSPIVFEICTSGLMQWVAKRVSGFEGQTLVDDVRWLAT